MPRKSSFCAKEGVNKGAWTSEEDRILSDYVKIHGEGRWRAAAMNAGLNRCAKSCRLRWLNYLRPGIKRGNIAEDEEDLIIRLHRLLGNRWSLIAGRLPGRTDNEIKNFWNTTVVKKMKKTGSLPSLLLPDSQESEYEENEGKNAVSNPTSTSPNGILSDPADTNPLLQSCGLLRTSTVDVDQGSSLNNNNNGQEFFSSTSVEDNKDDDDINYFTNGTTNDHKELSPSGFDNDPELIWPESGWENCMLASNSPSVNESLCTGDDAKEEHVLRYESQKEEVNVPLDVELKKLASFLDLDEEWREE